MPINSKLTKKSNYFQNLSNNNIRPPVLWVQPIDHCQWVQDQEALNRVTDGLRHPSLFFANAHQELQLVSPSPHEALASIVGNPAHKLCLI